MITSFTQVRQRLHRLDYDLDMATQADGEQGVRFLSELRSKEWAQDNPELIKWLKEFKQLVEDVGPDEGN